MTVTLTQRELELVVSEYLFRRGLVPKKPIHIGWDLAVMREGAVAEVLVRVDFERFAADG